MARLNAARATSTMSAVGSAVVIRCKARPGARTALASLLSEAAAAFSTSYPRPATTGMNRSRVSTRGRKDRTGMQAKKRMDTIMTRNR